MEAFMGLIALFGFNFAPMSWAICQGQLIAISQNAALFSLLGTVFGGNGSTNFALPDLRGRVIIGAGAGTGLSNYTFGQMAGTESATLSASNMPSHNHTATLSNASATVKAYSATGASATPTSRANVLSGSTGTTIYGSTAPDTILNIGGGAVTGNVAVANNGSSAPFSIIQPYCALNYCIALYGLYPSRE